MDFLLQLDRELFVFINQSMTTHFFDQVMPIVTDLHKQPLFWISVLGLIAFSILGPIRTSTPESKTPLAFREIRKTRAKKWAAGVLILGLSMGLADLVAYRAIKIWVQRDRPEAAGVAVTLRTESHSGWSFPSNHAANNFAMARTVQILAPGWSVAAYAFAAVVAFSRVYVGVHYPLDVIAGGVIGFLCASLVSFVVRKIRARKIA